MSILSKIAMLAKLGPIDAIKAIWHNILFGKAFAFFEKLGIHILPVHFYSPVPDTRELRRNLQQWNKDWDFTGVDFNEYQQIQLLQCLSNFRNEYATLPEYKFVQEMGFGEGYGEVESHILYGMVRHFKPKQIIEVGSGISTYYSINALTKNQNEGNLKSHITCIEPFPKRPLFSLSENPIVKILPKLVQDVDIASFKSLQKGDILFIDSSHIAKINSDVYHLYLRILPILNAGVIIHIHDISFPHLTPDNPGYWIFKKHQFWNEAALLKAFLSFNKSFEILLCSSYLHYKNPDMLSSVFNIYDNKRHFPSSIWIRRMV
jgi:predicted O-methyltransferase YrrM